MPHSDDFPHPYRYNTLRLLVMITVPSFDLVLSRWLQIYDVVFLLTCSWLRVSCCLLSDETLMRMRLRAFTLMPNHLHFIAGVREPETNLSDLIGNFKSYTTQLYWKRSREIVTSEGVSLPSNFVTRSNIKESQPLISALMDWRATLRPEVVELKNWPMVKPGHFLKKRLWQTRIFDDVIRNDFDLRENLDYIAMNPVREGYVAHPQFYPYTGFFID